MRTILILLSFYVLVSSVDGFFPNIKFPTLPICRRKPCKTNGDCGNSEACVKVPLCRNKFCLNKFACKDKCSSSADCFFGQSCQPTSCGKVCQKLDVCPKSCKIGVLNSCPIGLVCQKTGGKCGYQCVEYKAPLCPVLHPNMAKLASPVNECTKFKKGCNSNKECNTFKNEFCCYSPKCNTSICTQNGFKCSISEAKNPSTKLCRTGADCSPTEVCVVHEGGCTKCSKGFQCPGLTSSCTKDSDCTLPQQCRANENGCFVCQLPPSDVTNPPSSCIGRKCVTDASCFPGEFCLLKAPGCKVCTIRLNPGPSPCHGRRCISDLSCGPSEICSVKAADCRVCTLRFNPGPSPCLGRKCISDLSCGPSEICSVKAADCRVCAPRTCPKICSVSSIISSCPPGYKCQFGGKCGTECVKSVPQCPIYHPEFKPTPDWKTLCNTSPTECKPNGCGKGKTCCHSIYCKKMVCTDTANTCPRTELKKCTTDADCIATEFCVLHRGGCKKCSKGFLCPSVISSCITNLDCKISQECVPIANGCSQCKTRNPSVPNPPPPSRCHGTWCKTDQDCKNGQKCMLENPGCKICRSKM